MGKRSKQRAAHKKRMTAERLAKLRRAQGDSSLGLPTVMDMTAPEYRSDFESTAGLSRR